MNGRLVDSWCSWSHGWSGRIGTLAGAMLVTLLAGCAPPDEPGEPGEPGVADEARDRPGTDRPAEQQLSMEVEGMAEDQRVILYRTPTDFPLPFSTYVPQDMIAEASAPGAGYGVRFVANFGGHRNDAAAVRLVVAGENATEEDLVARLREVARELGTELVPEPESRFAWSDREFRNVATTSRAAAAEGIMGMGRRDGRLFAIALHYPAEYGDGFGPRARIILDEWRWADTGEPLGR